MDNRWIAILFIILIFTMISIFIFNGRRRHSTSIAIATIISGIIVALTYSIFTYLIFDVDQGNPCQIDLNSNSCTDPNAYCTDIFNSDANKDNCFLWCSEACFGTSPQNRLCYDDKCLDGKDCNFVNIDQTACYELRCPAEIKTAIDDTIGCNIEELILNASETCAITTTCQSYCLNEGKYKDGCIDYYCAFNFVYADEFGLDNICVNLCKNTSLSADTCLLLCEFDEDSVPNCACRDIESTECEEYCKNKDPLTDSLCLQQLCYEEPTNSNCLTRCTTGNENELQCEWACFLCIRLYFKSVYDGSYIANRDSIGPVCTTLQEEDAMVMEITSTRLDKNGKVDEYIIISKYGENECTSTKIPTSYILGGNSTYKVEFNNFNELDNPTFELETSTISNIYYVKTKNYYQVGGISGFEGFKQKYLTLGCDGLTLEFYNSIRTLQQWHIIDINGNSPCLT